MKIQYKHVQGGNVPGGHNVIISKKGNPFITPTKELNSIALRHSDVVVDIGAYTGLYAIRCARFPVKQVIAYEPTPASFAILKLTNLPNLELHNAAVVGNDIRFVSFYVSPGIGVTNSLICGKRKATKVTVPAVSYEKAVRNASIVKIDIEGGEYALGNIIQPQIRALIIDFHPIGIKTTWIAKAEMIIAQIHAAGFRTVIKPNWQCGWTRAGSWIREVETTGSYEPMMQGKVCCGCGQNIGETAKSLCRKCWDEWLPKHRQSYRRARL